MYNKHKNVSTKITNEIDSVSYSLGVNIGENIKSQFQILI